MMWKTSLSRKNKTYGSDIPVFFNLYITISRLYPVWFLRWGAHAPFGHVGLWDSFFSIITQVPPVCSWKIGAPVPQAACGSKRGFLLMNSNGYKVYCVLARQLHKNEEN